MNSHDSIEPIEQYNLPFRFPHSRFNDIIVIKLDYKLYTIAATKPIVFYVDSYEDGSYFSVSSDDIVDLNSTVVL